MVTQSNTEDYMARAIALARQAVGTVSPNPPVGAVIVRDGEIVGEGFTQPPGGPHAEVQALSFAGKAAQGADMYVTLEPCPLHGRTPPCTLAIISAGIKRIHVAALDPNPATSRLGVSTLEAANVSVILGENSTEALQLIEAFGKHVTTRMPFVIAKFAMSLDGKIATRTGDSKWISSPEARQFAHELRADVDAIMVGIGTALADDPQLTARSVRPKVIQPTRIVVDSAARLPTNATMLSEDGETIVAIVAGTKRRIAALRQAGAEVLTVPGENEGVDLRKLLVTLGQRDITSVLVEGGSLLLGSLFDQHLVDKVVGIVAPVLIGGNQAKGPIDGLGALTIAEAVRVSRVTHHVLGGDMIVTGYLGS